MAAREGGREARGRLDRSETWSEDRDIEGREEARWRMRKKIMQNACLVFAEMY